MAASVPAGQGPVRWAAVSQSKRGGRSRPSSPFVSRAGQAVRSNRSAFITFTQAAMKSLTNFSSLSSWA